MRSFLGLAIALFSSHFSFSQNFSPSEFHPALWLDAADASSIIHTGGKIDVWNDKSSNRFKIIQTAVNHKPTYVSSINGINFEGDDILLGNNLGYGQDTTITIFVVAEPDAGSDKGSVIAKGHFTSGSDYRIELGQKGYDVAIQGAREWNSSGGDWNIAHKNLLHTYYSVEKEVGYYLNGERVETPRQNVEYSPNNTEFAIGGRSNYSDYFKGKIYEILLFQRKLTRQEILQVEGYLIHKWNLQTHIIESHPFKEYPFGIGEEIETSVRENSKYGTVIEELQGSYVNNKVKFSNWRIEDEGYNKGTFELSSNGVLSVLDRASLDYELNSAINIEVSALVNSTRVYGGVRVNIMDMPDGDHPKNHSILWGVNGEKWDPRGRLPDFSYVGYKNGEEPYHYIDHVVDVTDFGAKPNDQHSDVNAIVNAIESLDSGIVYFPPGYYVIDQIIQIRKNNIVLRGAGNDSIAGTRFYFPKSQQDLSNEGKPSGFMISFGGTLAGPQFKIIEEAKMGDRSMTVEDASRFSVGDIVNLGYSGSHPVGSELWNHLLNDQGNGWPCTVPWSNGNGGLLMFHTIERIEGNIVTLKEPIRLDIKTAWNPKISLRSPWFIKNCGIEDIYMAHKYIPEPPHLKEPGYNSIAFSRALNCWVKNVSIKNADNGIRFDVSGFCDIRNVTFLGRAGHHGWTFAYSSHCLADRIKFLNYNPWIHSFTLTHKANGNVVSNLSGVDSIGISSDFHRNTPWETLITNVQNKWNYHSSGVWCAGPNAGKRTVYWNMGGEGFTSYPNWDDYQTTLVGQMHIPEQFHPEKGWHEHVSDLEPKNLYDAQLKRRLNSPQENSFTSDAFSGNRKNYWERDPSRWKVEKGSYRLFFSEIPELKNGKLGEYTLLDSVFSSDTYVSAKMNSLENLSINSDANAALIMNYQDDNNYYFALYCADEMESGMYKVENGVSRLLLSVNLPLSNTSSYNSFAKKDDMLICYQNGIAVDSVRDNTFSGGKVGFGSLSDAVLFDDIILSMPNDQSIQDMVKFRVYPNPVSDYLIINTQDNEIPSYRVFTITGGFLASGSGNLIDFSALKNGAYLIEVNTEASGRHHFKVMK